MKIDRRTVLGLLPAAALLGCARLAAPDRINIFKTRSCGCCGAWVEHLRQDRFDPVVEDVDDLALIARRYGVPDQLRSCHTAAIGGYFIEGHVPAADIRRLLTERPQAAGLAVPGMPIGSPGMEQGETFEAYDTLLVDRGGQTRVFTRHYPRGDAHEFNQS